MLWVTAAAVVVLGGVYGGLATFLAGHVAGNVTVDGVAIGGMSPREATVALQRVLAGESSLPVHLTVPSGAVDIQPGEAGLRVDLRATVAGLTGFTMDPLTMWAHMTGVQNQHSTLLIDRGKLTAAVTKAAGALDRTMKEGSITFTGGRANQVLSVAGVEVRA